MRNPARIDLMCDTLKKVWRKYPDLRLFQLICALGTHSESSEVALFYIEDHKWYEWMQEELK